MNTPEIKTQPYDGHWQTVGQKELDQAKADGWAFCNAVRVANGWLCVAFHAATDKWTTALLADPDDCPKAWQDSAAVNPQLNLVLE